MKLIEKVENQKAKERERKRKIKLWGKGGEEKMENVGEGEGTAIKTKVYPVKTRSLTRKKKEHANVENMYFSLSCFLSLLIFRRRRKKSNILKL